MDRSQPSGWKGFRTLQAYVGPPSVLHWVSPDFEIQVGKEAVKPFEPGPKWV